MKQQIYRPVPGYEGLYEINPSGSIRNVQTGKELRPRRHNQYLRVRLYKDQLGREKFVHALTRAAFPELYPEKAPKPPKKPRTDTTYLQEEWRPIYGTQKAYEVSNMGRVRHVSGDYQNVNDEGIVGYKPRTGKYRYRTIRSVMADSFEPEFIPKFKRVNTGSTKKQVERAGKLYDTGMPMSKVAKTMKLSIRDASVLIFNYRAKPTDSVSCAICGSVK